MIDFRYHLVSLISVFLALAVGIVLGAGPLKEAIGDTLSGEVDQLRARAADLRAELDQSNVELVQSEDAFAAVAPDLLAGILEDRRIAVIEIGGTAGPVLEQVSERIVEAGATVTGTVRVTSEWTDPGRPTYRQTLAGTLVEYLDPAPPTAASTATELAEALAQALTTPAADNPDARSEDAVVVLQLLAEAGLVDLAGELLEPADAIVLVVGPTADVADEATQVTPGAEPTAEDLAQLQESVKAATEIAVAAEERSGGVVVAGHELVEGGVLRALRDDARTSTRVSTVTSVHTLVGQVSVPLALADQISGEIGHYGSDPDATAAVPPRVVLVPPQRPVPDGTVGTETPATDPAQTPATDGTPG